jgi:hypothetical protein
VGSAVRKAAFNSLSRDHLNEKLFQAEVSQHILATRTLADLGLPRDPYVTTFGTLQPQERDPHHSSHPHANN